MSSRVLRSFLAGALLAGGCGPSTSSRMGTLVVALTDAPSPDVKGIVVTIDTVTAHSDQAGWVTVAHGPITVDLLALHDVTMELGEVDLPAGTVSEVRGPLFLAGSAPRLGPRLGQLEHLDRDGEHHGVGLR